MEPSALRNLDLVLGLLSFGSKKERGSKQNDISLLYATRQFILGHPRGRIRNFRLVAMHVGEALLQLKSD